MEYDYDVDDEYGGRILWGRIAFFGIGLILFFAIGRCTASGVPEDELANSEAEVAELSAQVTTLEAEVQALRVGGGGTVTETESPTDDGTPDGTETDGEGDGNGDGEPPTGGDTYTVTEGDTLFTIAEEVYGDGTLYTLIVEANGLDEDNPLTQGQVLQIPEEEST